MAKKEKPPKPRCLICGHGETDRAHIRSKGAGGTWEPANIISLCRPHHVQQHQIGWVRFLGLYPTVKSELYSRGWGIRDVGGIEKLVKP